jgi:long-chain acyl-CoA synthetase
MFRCASGLTITWASAAARVVEAMDWLARSGVRRGDRLVCYEEQTLPLAFVDLACAFVGVVPIPLSPLYSPSYLGELATLASASSCVFAAPQRAASAAESRLSPICFPIGAPDDCVPTESERSPADVLAALRRGAAEWTEQSPFIIMPTSGSSGRPKLVVRRDVAALRYARHVGGAIRASSPDGVPERFLAVAALTHAFGLHMFTTALVLGAELVVPRSLDTSAALSEIRALDPTILPMTPRVVRAIFRQFEEVQGDERTFGPSARLVLIAGGPSDAPLVKNLRRQGVEVCEFYGSTEASIVALTPHGEWREGWAGRVVDDTEVKLLPDGELLVRTPGMMTGYHGDVALTSASMDDEGYFRTGDFAELTDDRWLRIRGRKRDVFNTPEGANIYPQRIESVIETWPWVRQAMLVGDQLPYITAYVVCDETDGYVVDDQGFVIPEANPAVYAVARTHFAMLNMDVERIERIICFALFARPFDAGAYTTVGASKVRRDRKAFMQTYEKVISFLYARASPIPHWSMFVPGAERRLRPRIGWTR